MRGTRAVGRGLVGQGAGPLGEGESKPCSGAGARRKRGPQWSRVGRPELYWGQYNPAGHSQLRAIKRCFMQGAIRLMGTRSMYSCC